MWGLKREYYRCDICGRECEAPPTISCDWCQRNICKECLAWEKAPSMKYQEKYRQDPRKFPTVLLLHDFRLCVLCDEELKARNGKRLLEIFEEGRKRLHGNTSGGD